MWTYQIATRCLLHDGEVVSNTGWAGQGPWQDDPTETNVEKKGPLPCGLYTIGPAYHHDKLGPVTMNLGPDAENEMFGRADFRIHGASATDSAHSSEGCIIQLRSVREQIAASPDRRLEVVPGT